MNKIIVFLSVLSISFSFSCSGQRAFTKGEYTDPDRVIHLTDKFNESDMKLLVKDLMKSLEKHYALNSSKISTVYIERVSNSTSEHINMKSMTDKLRTALLKTGKIKFHDKDQRKVLDSEYNYQNKSGNVRRDTVIKRGNQIGTDYIISGDLASNTQELGAKKAIYYKLTLNLTDVKTGLIVWSDEKELKKLYKKRSYSM
jgi:penicillin-binding protein activator